MVANDQCPMDLAAWFAGTTESLRSEKIPLLDISRFIRAVCSLFELAMPIIVNAQLAKACEICLTMLQKLKKADAMCPTTSSRPSDSPGKSFGSHSS
jgi:hypothetical protein